MIKRGFTLIELLGIVIILALILSVSFPVYLNMIKTNKEKKESSLRKDLCLAGESYLYENQSMADINNFLSRNTSSYIVTIKTLVEDDFVDKMLFDKDADLENYYLTFSFDADNLQCSYTSN